MNENIKKCFKNSIGKIPKKFKNLKKKLLADISNFEGNAQAIRIVHTLQDLTSKSESEMMKIRNLGKKSLKEVLDKVKDMGLKFRDED